jgi:aminopeptidase N
MLDKAAKAEGRVLLPDYVVPTRYNLKITPDLVQYTFDGLVSIDMTTKDSFTDEESKMITLHAKELMFRSAKFQTTGGSVVMAHEVLPKLLIDVFFVGFDCFTDLNAFRYFLLLSFPLVIIKRFVLI